MFNNAPYCLEGRCKMYMGLRQSDRSIQISSIADQTLQRSFKVNFHSRQGFGLVGCLIS